MENTPQVQTPQEAGVKLEELKKKLEEYVKDLKGLVHEYDLPDFAPDNLPAELEHVSKQVYNAKIVKSKKEVLTLVANALDEQVNKALEEGKALQNAYNNNNIANMFKSAVEIYANLFTINTLVKYIEQYINVLGFIKADVEAFTKKAKNTIAILANYISKNVRLNDDDAEELGKDTIYYHDLAENWTDLEDALEQIEFELDNDTELRRGTYKALTKTLGIMQKLHDEGVSYGHSAWEMIPYNDEEEKYKAEGLDVETFLLNIVEAYANFIALKVVYDDVMSEYITNEKFEDALKKAINRARDVIDIILNSYNNS
ncbi:MAG: hypothetical protein QXU98_14690 [Candidatus Parvarchaeota archaeon]